MTPASLEEVRRMAEWTPRLGVVSIYLRLDPADRAGGWRTELRNGLAAMLDGEASLDHETAAALRSTAERIGERFANHERSLPRGEAGFVEVAARAGEETWWPSHVEPSAGALVEFGERALIAPLIHLLERGSPRGVALLSAERVRLLDWAPGRIEELHSWELSVFSGDWRERKSQRVADPARAQGVSASGRDQFDERLEESRHHFLGECGRLTAQIAPRRGWTKLVLFGTGEHRNEFESGIPSGELTVQTGDGADLISEPAGRLEGPIAEAAERLDAAGEIELVERAIREAQGGRRGTAGVQETEAALGEGRVESLVFDAARAAEFEQMVRRALESGAALAAVSGEGAERLASVGGVAAMLRY
ncbi:MAG TPA: VLRF1 family aeRF1-type release factor [Solirubrobacterales bacterium]